jgi:hypothetical protein
MKRMETPRPQSQSGQTQIIVLVCFALLGALTGRDQGQTALLVLVYAIVAAALGWLAVRALAWLAGMLSARGGQPRDNASAAVRRGFLMLVPFTALALLADLVLGWGATQAFMAAGLMTSAAVAGGELETGAGEKGVPRIVLTGVASLLSVMWIVLSNVLAGVGK